MQQHYMSDADIPTFILKPAAQQIAISRASRVEPVTWLSRMRRSVGCTAGLGASSYDEYILAEHMLKWANEPTSVGPIRDGEYNSSKDTFVASCQRFVEEFGDLRRVIPKRTTTPCTQNQCVVFVQGGYRQDSANPTLHSRPDVRSPLRAML